MQNSAAIHIFTNLQALAVQCVNKIDVKVHCTFILILATYVQSSIIINTHYSAAGGCGT